MITIEPLDNVFLATVTDKTVTSLGKFKYKSCIEWRGETAEDEYFIIRYGSGFIAVGIGLTEYSAETDLSITGTVSTDKWFLNKTKIPTICDILQFLNWSLVDDDVYFE
jgi:hypothetical protein